MPDRALLISTLQPKQQNIWDLIIPDIEGFSGVEDTLILSMRNFPLPKSTTASITIPMDGTEAKFAGKTTFQDMQVTFNDYLDRDTALLVKNWRSLVFNNETGASGLVSAYKRNGYANVYTSEEEYISTYKLIGVWPSSDDYGSLDKGSAEVVQISITLTIDRAYLGGPVVVNT
jgi:hypothetical protein